MAEYKKIDKKGETESRKDRDTENSCIAADIRI
jgi:hypothetical protein